VPPTPPPTQTPAAQVAAPEHTTPQLPQFAALVWTSTQAPLQSVKPAPHESEQRPCEQTCPLHVTPQPPQWLGSSAVFAQTPPQSVVSGAQAQTPAVQIWDVAQATLQSPQWAGSALRSVHPAPQSVWPAKQPVTAVPRSAPRDPSLGEQALRHAAQRTGSQLSFDRLRKDTTGIPPVGPVGSPRGTTSGARQQLYSAAGKTGGCGEPRGRRRTIRRWHIPSDACAPRRRRRHQREQRPRADSPNHGRGGVRC
jgi:hypothetical protein